MELNKKVLGMLIITLFFFSVIPCEAVTTTWVYDTDYSIAGTSNYETKIYRMSTGRTVIASGSGTNVRLTIFTPYDSFQIVTSHGFDTASSILDVVVSEIDTDTILVIAAAICNGANDCKVKSFTYTISTGTWYTNANSLKTIRSWSGAHYINLSQIIRYNDVNYIVYKSGHTTDAYMGTYKVTDAGVATNDQSLITYTAGPIYMYRNDDWINDYAYMVTVVDGEQNIYTVDLGSMDIIQLYTSVDGTIPNSPYNKFTMFNVTVIGDDTYLTYAWSYPFDAGAVTSVKVCYEISKYNGEISAGNYISSVMKYAEIETSLNDDADYPQIIYEHEENKLDVYYLYDSTHWRLTQVEPTQIYNMTSTLTDITAIDADVGDMGFPTDALYTGSYTLVKPPYSTMVFIVYHSDVTNVGCYRVTSSLYNDYDIDISSITPLDSPMQTYTNYKFTIYVSANGAPFQGTIQAEWDSVALGTVTTNYLGFVDIYRTDVISGIHILDLTVINSSLEEVYNEDFQYIYVSNIPDDDEPADTSFTATNLILQIMIPFSILSLCIGAFVVIMPNSMGLIMGLLAGAVVGVATGQLTMGIVIILVIMAGMIMIYGKGNRE